MKQATMQDVATVPRIMHAEAMHIAAVENAKFTALLRSFAPDDWDKPTDCVLWDVHALAAHVVGSAASQVSPREFVRQVRKGRPLVAEIGAQYWWDGMNELQVRERVDLLPAQLIAEWEAQSAKALRARTPAAAPNRQTSPAQPPGTGRAAAGLLPLRRRVHPRCVDAPHRPGSSHWKAARSRSGPRRAHRRRHRGGMGDHAPRALRPRARGPGRGPVHGWQGW